jgi:microcystin-dependent protein
LDLLGSEAPVGFLLCNDSVYAQSNFPDLFAIIGQTYDNTVPSGYFRTPDLRGRSLVRAGIPNSPLTNTYYVGTYLGEENHLLTINEIPSHKHSVPLRYPNSGAQVNSVEAVLSQANYYGQNGQGANPIPDLTLPYTGGGASHNNLAPILVGNYIIKY